MRIIKVQGKGTVSVPPDTVILSFEIASQAPVYADCLQDLNARTEGLRQAIKASSKKRTDLKTVAFDVRADTKTKNGQYLSISYRASHRLQIELPVDTQLLNLVLYEVAKGQSGAEIRLTFTVKDKDGLRNRVLTDAVKVAKANAVVLAEAAGLKLGKIQQIDYGWAEVRFYEHEANTISEAPSMTREYAADIDPADVRAEDNVTLVYAIED